MSLNLSGRMPVDSRTYGWEEEVVGVGGDDGCDSSRGGFLILSPSSYFSSSFYSSILVRDSLFTLIRIKVHLSIYIRR